jgi:hypothetical protein
MCGEGGPGFRSLNPGYITAKTVNGKNEARAPRRRRGYGVTLA